jgi:hypothetical protein
MLEGLALPKRRSLYLRVPIFILCYVPLPLDMLGGLALPILWSPDLWGCTISSLMPSTIPLDMLRDLAKANIWVVRP